MIFYFSATGNSKWAAQLLASKTNDRIVSIVDVLCDGSSCEFALKAGEKIGFVFPVHGWRVPSIVREFISCVKLLIPDLPSSFTPLAFDNFKAAIVSAVSPD